MSAQLAEPSPPFERVTATHSLSAQLRREGVALGAAGHGAGCAAVSTEPLSSLETLPWLAPTGVGPTAAPAGRNWAARERAGLMLHGGLAAVLALLGAAAWQTSDAPLAPPVPAVEQAPLPHGIVPAPSPTAAGIAQADTAARLDEALLAPTDAAARAGREADAARPQAAAQRSSRPTPAVTRVVPAPAAAPAAASIVAPPPPPVADSPVTSATLRQYRSAMDGCRDTISDIIRLGDRQKPGRDASPAELARYRLRQQNADAAKTYRTYLDTLARSVRGTNSETLTRQSLERARQTRGYLDTMLADSKAALR